MPGNKRDNNGHNYVFLVHCFSLYFTATYITRKTLYTVQMQLLNISAKLQKPDKIIK